MNIGERTSCFDVLDRMFISYMHSFELVSEIE